jgi:hypothetical protein
VDTRAEFRSADVGTEHLEQFAPIPVRMLFEIAHGDWTALQGLGRKLHVQCAGFRVERYDIAVSQPGNGALHVTVSSPTYGRIASK